MWGEGKGVRFHLDGIYWQLRLEILSSSSNRRLLYRLQFVKIEKDRYREERSCIKKVSKIWKTFKKKKRREKKRKLARFLIRSIKYVVYYGHSCVTRVTILVQGIRMCLLSFTNVWGGIAIFPENVAIKQ